MDVPVLDHDLRLVLEKTVNAMLLPSGVHVRRENKFDQVNRRKGLCSRCTPRLLRFTGAEAMNLAGSSSSHHCKAGRNVLSINNYLLLVLNPFFETGATSSPSVCQPWLEI